MRRVTTIREVRDAVAAARADGARIGLLPTMGALHAGHLANARLVAEHTDVVVVSIFVNPTQFDRADDLAAYPRDLAADEAALVALGAAAPALVFVPSVEEMYPHTPRTSVHVAELGEVLEGASRPGHFDGVATVVTKLCNIVRPDVAVFGRKDHQQLQVVRQLVGDLDLDLEVLAAPTVREADGVALSSRNQRLAADERPHARALPGALAAAVRAARDARAVGRAPEPDELERAALAVLDGSPVAVDYLVAVDPVTLRPPAPSDDPARRLTVAVAASIGAVRLIDNVEVGDLDDETRLLAALGAASPATEV
jgi:pantoate--beta-alanine ligase